METLKREHKLELEDVMFNEVSQKKKRWIQDDNTYVVFRIIAWKNAVALIGIVKNTLGSRL